MKRTTTDPTIAIGYVRVSTDAQTLGPEAQRAAIESWARAAGVVVVAWHADHGVSGAKEAADRPGLAAALADVKARRAGALVVAKRDRLARDVVVAATVDRAVGAMGARVVAADGTGNGDAPADAFLRVVVDGAAEYERALIRARTRAALAAKRARGERAGEVPYGFTADADGRLSPNAVELAVVAAVRDLRAAGLSLRAIVDALAARGVVSRAGRPLALTQVARLARVAA